MFSRRAIQAAISAAKAGRGLFKQPAREFNAATLGNAHRYLVENKDKIVFEKNESGFIRTTFPNWVFVPDSRVAPLQEGERLRANFWYHTEDEIGMGDESVHDHPSAFQSYIVTGGYEHELYRVTLAPDPREEFQHLRLDLNQDELWQIYQNYVAAMNASPKLVCGANDPGAASTKYKFEIDKATKVVTSKGAVRLRMTGVEATRAGDIVEIDPHMIHRVSKFQVVPGIKTLSLNIVRNQTKGKTNIYSNDPSGAAVQTVRAEVSPEETKDATEQAIYLIGRARAPK